MRGLRAASLPALQPTGAMPTTGIQAGLTLGLSVLAGLALVLSPDWWIAFGLLGVAGLTAFGLIQPALFLALFLIVRPVLDQFSTVTAGVPSANVGGALGGLLLAITIVVLALRRRGIRVPGTAPLVAIALVSALAAVLAQYELGSQVGTRSIGEILRLAALVAVFLLAAHMTTSEDKARTLFVIVALSALVPACWGIGEFIVGAPMKETESVARISGTFTGPVPYGAFLAFAALLLVFGPVERIPGWFRWTFLALTLFALTESFSRVGWVLFLVGMVILAWPKQKRLVGAIVAGVVIVMLVSPDVRGRALPVGTDEPTASSSAAGYESFGWRLENWGGLLEQWSEKPLLGYGLDSTTFVNTRAPVDFDPATGGGFAAHNMIVRILVEGGVVLLIVYLAFYAFVIRRMWRLSRASWPLADAARLLMVVWCLTLFTGATTDDPFTLTAMMVGMLALTGALEGAWRSATLEQRASGRAIAPGYRPGAFWRPAAPGSGAG